MKVLFKVLAVLAVVGLLAFGVTSFISACTGHINAEVDEDCESVTVSANPQDWYDNKVKGDYLTWYKYIAPAAGTGTFAWDPILAKTMDFTVTATFETWTRADKDSPWVKTGPNVQESETVTAQRPGKCRWTICHVAGRKDDPANYITLTLPLEGVLGHFDENGTQLAGHEDDHFGACVVPHCLKVTPTYGPWTEWAVDPVKDPTLATEYRTRTVQNVDFYDNTVLCGEPYTETESRTRDLCVVKEISGYGEWSPWTTDPNDESKEIHSRLVYYVDGIDHKTSCGTDVLTESRDRPKCEWNPDLYYNDPECHAPACTTTTTVYGEWSDWEPYPADLSQEYHHRDVTYLDSVDPTIVCGSNVEYEYRPRELCVVTTISGYGEWTPWAVDPQDPAIEFRTRDVYLVDGIDGTHSCGTTTQRETRPRDRCPYNPDLWADDPLCKERCPYNPDLFIDDPNCKEPAKVYPCATCDPNNSELQKKPGDIVVTRYATCDIMPWCVAPIGHYTIWSDVYFYLMRLGIRIEPVETVDPSGQKWYTIDMPALLLGTYAEKNPRAGGFYLVRDDKDVDPSIVQLFNGACACTNYWHLVDGSLVEKTVKDANGKDVTQYFYQMRLYDCYKNSWETIQFVKNEYYPTVMGQTITEDEASKIVTPQWIKGPAAITILLPAPAPK